MYVGNTIVVAAVTGEVVAPYPDRPSEGILLFSVEVSPMTEAKGGVSTYYY